MSFNLPMLEVKMLNFDLRTCSKVENVLSNLMSDQLILVFSSQYGLAKLDYLLKQLVEEVMHIETGSRLAH